MKSNHILFASVIIAGMLAGCKKHELEPLPFQYGTDAPNLKVVHASAFTTNTAVQLKLNDVRISNNMTYSTPFPGGGQNTGGSNFPYWVQGVAGSNKISLSIPKAGTATDSVVVSNNTVTLEKGKSYTAYITDTGANNQLILVTENLALPAQGTSRYRFINLIPNLASADLYYGPTLVASNVAYKSLSPEFTLTTGQALAFAVRTAGSGASGTVLATYTPAAVPNQRILTVYSRGYLNTGTTGNRLPAVSLLYNQ